MDQTSFFKLGLIAPLEKRLKEKKYNSPTPIQEKTISKLLDGNDLLGIAQTGSGKTAAFSLPILQHLSSDIINSNPVKIQNSTQEKRKPIPRALIIAPTRELALQIGKSIESYGQYIFAEHTVIYGGIKQLYQVAALRRGVDIIVVLDEADLMLDMGFIKDIEKVLQKLPSKKQTMLFSATMPKEVSKLAKDILVNPIRVDVTPKKIILDQIKQYVYLIDTGNKMNLLLDLLKSKKMTHTIIFRKTKRGANYLGQKLYRSGFRAETIHGDKTQAARQRALRQFEKGRAKILVATDVAARGIDFSRVSHVVNYELPNFPENYIHRIGRTARAGSEGVAYSFCDVSEMSFLRNIERKSKQKIKISPHSYQTEKKKSGNTDKSKKRTKYTRQEKSTSEEKINPRRNKRRFENNEKDKKPNQSTSNKDKVQIITSKEKKRFYSHKKKKSF